MQRFEAKKLASISSDEDIKKMCINAQSQIKDWTKRSRINKGMTIGATFNILTKCGFEHIHILVKTNLIREFGEYLPNYQKKKKKIFQYQKPHHQEPEFIKG